MNETDLHDALDRATDAIARPDLARASVGQATSQRRRRQRVGTVLGVASVSLAIIVGSVVLFGSDPSVNPSPGNPTPSHTREPEEPLIGPPVDSAAVQDLWDPNDVESLPVDASLGLTSDLSPRGLAGDPSSPTLTAVDSGSGVSLLGSSGLWPGVEFPEGPLEYVGRTLALEDDGSRVAVTGRSGLWWRDVVDGTWAKVDYPRDMQLPTDATIALSFADHGTVLISHWGRFWLVDLQSGAAERLPFDLFDEVMALGDYLVVNRFADTTPDTRAVEQYDDGELVSSINPLLLDSLQRWVANGSSIAVTRGSGVSGRRGLDDYDGMLALNRDGLTTRAYLPVLDENSYYADSAGLTAVGWLGDDVVLMAVRPRQPFDMTWLVTWDVETGDLARVASYPTGTVVALALGQLK